jgi:hypothetical protein
MLVYPDIGINQFILIFELSRYGMMAYNVVSNFRHNEKLFQASDRIPGKNCLAKIGITKCVI